METRLYESQIQQDEMYNTLKSKTNTLNPQLQEIRTVFAQTVLADGNTQTGDKPTLSLADQLANEKRENKLRSKEAIERWATESKNLQVLQE